MKKEKKMKKMKKEKKKEKKKKEKEKEKEEEKKKKKKKKKTHQYTLWKINEVNLDQWPICMYVLLSQFVWLYNQITNNKTWMQHP